jgi:PIN domain
MKLSLEEIHAHIVGKKITAISLDTTVFERSSLDLESGLLLRLRQFKGSRVRFVLSAVVAGEVQAHLMGAANDALSSLEKATNELKKGWLVSRERGSQLHTSISAGHTPATMVHKRWTEFIARSGVVVISVTEYGDVDEVLRRYFEVQPPFEPSELKKHEFPDAIALIGLERWAAANRTQVLVVTHDKGWQRFCEASDRLIVVENLGHALDSFQEDVARILCADLSESLAKGDPLEIGKAIRLAVKEQQSNIDVDVEINSQFSVEEDDLEFETKFIEITDASGGTALSAIDYDGKTLDAEVHVMAEARGKIWLSFAKWDSIDKEYISMGSTVIDFVEPLELEAIITFKRHSREKLVIENVEIQSQSVTLHYGDLEPDWMRDPANFDRN